MNQISLTPIVKNILIINVLIWLALMILPRINPQLERVGHDYFALHKIDVLPIRPKATIGNDGFYIKRSSKVNPKAAVEMYSQNPESKQFWGEVFAGPTEKFVPIQVILWFFFHESFLHILFNMIVLISIGPSVERVLGPKRFLALYLFCGIIGGLFVAFLDPSPYPVLGASGAALGVVLAFALNYPTMQLQLLFFIPVTALNLVKWVGIISAAFIVIDFMGIDVGSLGGISHFGHLAGMAAALLYFYVEKYIPFLNN